ncbi:hypothetical protein HY844_01525 [Candidatus Berkelbacteria bacterium]|nr:hypothetical protein [Candidatus Berkelbacteria bacterium]
MSVNKYRFLFLLLSAIIFPTFASAATLPYLKITFPPSYVLTPKEVSYNGGAPCSVTATDCNGSKLEYKILGADTVSNPYDDYSELIITDIKKLTAANSLINNLNKISEKILQSYQAKAYSPPPAGNLFIFIKPPKSYEFKVTFKPYKGNQNSIVITTKTVENYLDNLSSAGSSNINRGYPGDDNCGYGTTTDYTSLCLKSEFEYHFQGLSSERVMNQVLIQSLKLADAGIKFQGNTASPTGDSSGYGFSTPKAVALGGTVSIRSGDQINILQGYTGKSTNIDWNVVSAKLKTLYDKYSKGTPLPNSTFNANTYYLNSKSDPAINDISAFSSPPEGKLWYTPNGNYTLSRSGTQAIRFIGAGTVVVRGDLIINNDIICDQNTTRFGFIVAGNITFQNNAKSAGCGVFTALGLNGSEGKITFTNPINSSSWFTILVAKGNISLPPIVNGTLRINYYTTFANNPTVLFKDLLDIVFSAQ